ncbi:hypothetical protein BDZ91DRAFT_744300, partial [Kalaharituber pfeilii]
LTQEDTSILADSDAENQDPESGENDATDALLPISYSGQKTRSVIAIPERLRGLTFHAEQQIRHFGLFEGPLLPAARVKAVESYV